MTEWSNSEYSLTTCRQSRRVEPKPDLTKMTLIEHTQGQSRSGQSVKIGWFIDRVESHFIFAPPRTIDAPGFDGRIVEIPCPVTVNIAVTRASDGTLAIVDADEGKGPLSPSKFRSSVVLTPRDRWRAADRPIVQIRTPYRFLSEDLVYLNQTSPFLHLPADPWPGAVIQGRFPIDVWPRVLVWAFEWHDLDRTLRLNRGEPWFYAYFETFDPESPVDLIEGEWTDDLKDYVKGMDGVTSFVNQTFSLFNTARERRPRKLLVEKSKP